MADTVKTLTVVDTHTRAAIHLTNLSDGTGEADVLKVNAAALFGAYRTITLTNASSQFFRIGETITSSGGATGVVADQELLANASVQVKVVSCTGTFGTGETITGGTSTVARVQTGAQVIPDYRFTLSRIAFSVLNGAAILTWQGLGGAANNRPAWTCADTGDIVFSELGGALRNDANSATGNMTLSTRGFIANSAYSILVNLQKTSGYTAILKERNMHFGYGNSF